jgi:hypothetical protein
MRVNGAEMVERMTSVEIEDVLSSIRRLVTEDLRPKPVAVSAVADDKLILTPALRVVPDVAPDAHGDDAALPDTQPDTQSDMLDIDLDADLAAALTHDDPQPDDAQLDDAALTGQDDTPDADTQADAGPYPMFLHHANRVDLAPETGGPDFADTVTTIGAGLPEDGYEAELGDAMAVPEWPESSWVAPDVIEGVEEAELIAVPETAFDAPHDGWATDAPVQPYPADADLQGDAADDAAEAAALAALAAEDDVPEAGALTELDEDMLRDIVRDIIREELHGSLGERITRNVRKLVRAEINRAMMTQDLD